MKRNLLANQAPVPWRVATSVGGKTYIYDAEGYVVIVPNISQTGRTPSDLLLIYQRIVDAVNQVCPTGGHHA